MHIEFLVEEPSMEAALTHLVPRIVSPVATFTFQVHTFSGKGDLLRKLPDRLRGYKSWIPDDWRIAVLVDEDRQDCHELKRQLEAAAKNAGLKTRAAYPGGALQVLNRIVIEELEAWYFGDPDALVASYPKLARSRGRLAKIHNPDAIPGGTWEKLEHELQRYGYHAGGLGKILAAQEIAPHMDPQRNHSTSFQAFRTGLVSLLA